MKAIQISRTGGTDVLDTVELPAPAAGPGEVLVKATAIGVNCFDTMIRTGRYRWMPKLPRREALAHAVELLGSGKVKPAIAACFPLAEARRAHDLIEARTAFGKIVLVP